MFQILLSTTTVYFFLISLINVILSSTKSICTVRYGRGINVLANVVAYSFYTIVVKQTAELPLEITVLATAVANALGVWLSYAILDRFQKDRLWKIEVTLPKQYTDIVHSELKDICHTYLDAGPKVRFDFLCETRKETSRVIKLCRPYGGKFFTAENRHRGLDRL
jgi:hypothetical protein